MNKQIAMPLIVLACFGLGTLIYLRMPNSGLPQPGDTVRPRLVRSAEWDAGGHGELWAELSATNEAGVTRRLNFSASPRVNPVAAVQFYGSNGESLALEKVELSQRC